MLSEFTWRMPRIKLGTRLNVITLCVFLSEDETINLPHNKPNKIVKQADVVLLGFPFHYNYADPDTRANDLNIYREVTDPLGPAMTWGMFCIGYKEIGDETQQEEMFYESFRPYVREPFKVVYRKFDYS